MSQPAVASLPRPGAPAPDFTLPSTAGTDVTLSKLRGRDVLLAFFPLAFTKALIEDKFFSNRASVLIDPEGIVRWAFSEETPGTRRENQALLDQLEAHRRSA